LVESGVTSLELIQLVHRLTFLETLLSLNNRLKVAISLRPRIIVNNLHLSFDPSLFALLFVLLVLLQACQQTSIFKLTLLYKMLCFGSHKGVVDQRLSIEPFFN
jgi:hypothetical protein